MPSVFTKIIARELPAFIVAEDENNMAILDINPLVLGHVLVFPKSEVDFLFDLPADQYLSLMTFTHELGNKMSLAFKQKRITMSVVGLEVAHAHIHLIPIESVYELNFSNKRKALTESDFQYCLKLLTE